MRVYPDHWALFLEFAEKNPAIITNKFEGPRGKEKIDALWAEITINLNCLGRGEKSTNEWKKTVIDWKSKTKAKAAAICKNLTQTGGGPSCSTSLSSFEERLLNIMGRTCVLGDRAVVERGLKRKKITESDIPVVHNYLNDEESVPHLQPSQISPSATTVIVDNINMVQRTPLAPIHNSTASKVNEKEQKLTVTPNPNRNSNNDQIEKENHYKQSKKGKNTTSNISVTEAKEAFVNMHEEVLNVLNLINLNLEAISNSLSKIATLMED